MSQIKQLLSSCKRIISYKESIILSKDLTQHEEMQINGFIRDVCGLQEMIKTHYAEYLI